MKFFRSIAALSILILSVPLPLESQRQSLGNVSGITEIDDGIRLTVPPAAIDITFLARDIVRIRMTKDGNFSPGRSWAVVNEPAGDRNFQIDERKDEILLTTPAMMVSIQKYPCRLSVYDNNGTLVHRDDSVKGMSFAGDEVAVTKEMPADEYYFGFGEKSGSLEKKGKAFSNWNTDIPAYKADTDPLYSTIPFFYGIRNGAAYGIFFDNTYYSFFNIGKENPHQYSFGAIDGELNYYFIYGPEPKSVLEKYSQLVGTMPLPPKWSIGYQQCRWSYYPESKVREIASAFRTKNIPCDAIYLDIHYMDGYRCFTWDKDRFPDPGSMVRDLAIDGFKLVVIIDPGIKNDSAYWVYQEGVSGNHFVRYPDGNYFTGTVWPGDCVFPDFTRKESREWWVPLQGTDRCGDPRVLERHE